jgi:hypothetical protein
MLPPDERKWPPDEPDWQNLLQRLPADADQAAVRGMVLAAAREYEETARRGRDLRLLKKQVRSKSFQKFRQIDLGEDVSSERLRRWITETTDEIPAIVEALTDAFSPSERRKRLFSTLSLAWTGPGKGKLSISESGPLVDFICGVADRVLVRSIAGRGVKDFADREKVRREAINVIKEVWSVQSSVGVDSFVIDAAGRRVGG